MFLSRSIKILGVVSLVLSVHAAEKKASPLRRNGNGNNKKLIAAIKSKNPKLVQALLTQGANPNATDGAERFAKTALIWAIRTKDMTSVRQLLVAGADVNQADSQGATPLWHAVTTLQPTLVQLLLDKGADITALNAQGDTVFDWLDKRRGMGELGAVDRKNLHAIRGILEDYHAHIEELRAAAQKAAGHVPPANLVVEYLAQRPERKKSPGRKKNGAGPAAGHLQRRM